MKSRHASILVGIALGLTTGAAGLAVAQDGLSQDVQGLGKDAAMAAKEALLIAREAELDEREERLAKREGGGGETFDCVELLNTFDGPPLPPDWSPDWSPDRSPAVPIDGQETGQIPGQVATRAYDTSPEHSSSRRELAAEVASTLKAMKPKKAGLVVVELERDLVADAMSTLTARSRAKILENVPPDVAAEIAAKLQRNR